MTQAETSLSTPTSVPHPTPTDVRSLQAAWHDAWRRANNPELDDDATAALCDVADAIEDQIRALPCDSLEVAKAHAEIVARDLSCGPRTNAAAGVDALAAGVSAFLEAM